MGGFGSRASRCAAAVALVAAGAVFTSTGSASAGSPATLNAVAACDSQSGEQVVTWTFHNFTNNYMDIQTATIDATALTAGSSLDTTVTFTPAANILSTAEAVGPSAASGDAIGVLTLTVTAYQSNIDTFVDFTGTVTLTGACVAAVTTTAAPVTTVAPVTTLTGSGGGSLPSSGSGSTLPIVAALLTAAGLGLLLLRRQSADGTAN